MYVQLTCFVFRPKTNLPTKVGTCEMKSCAKKHTFCYENKQNAYMQEVKFPAKPQEENLKRAFWTFSYFLCFKHRQSTWSVNIYRCLYSGGWWPKVLVLHNKTFDLIKD